MPWSSTRNRFYPSLRDEPWRFWRRVDTSDPQGCWPWSGLCSTNGYGRVGRHDFAHRFAAEVTIGPVPVDADVRQSCCNPPCCNPAHLSIVISEAVSEASYKRTLHPAYVAGIIDGEGSIGIHRSSRDRMYIEVGVKMGAETLLSQLRDQYGGNFGVIAVTEGYRPQWRWRVADRQAEALLREIRPYLLVKHEQADVVLSWYAIPALTRGERRDVERDRIIRQERDALKARITDLNRRGSPVGRGMCR